jgi:hypothetical protein
VPVIVSAREKMILDCDAYDHATCEKQTVIWSASDPDAGDWGIHGATNRYFYKASVGSDLPSRTEDC